MKKLFTSAVALCAAMSSMAAGWPANYGGVMLQGFSWDSYNYSQWTVLESQASEMKGFIDLVWVPQSGKCLETTQVMGYTPYYYFNQNSSFGTEAQLRSMISTFRANGIGTIADVVINHHNTDGWFGFPAETYKGTTYQLQSTDITSNDDGGATLKQAQSQGVSLSSNSDEGEDWSGMRDLDHKSTNVQNIMKAYTSFLHNDLGYAGFRYDMVKGYAGSHVGDYNDAAGVDYSIGEYWDSNSKIEAWINATGKRSAAFDFQFRYNVRDAINNSNWTELNSTNNLIHDDAYKQYAVTFVENHDMQDRGTTSGYTPDALLHDTLAANAYMLAMPGTPCIFQPHWRAYRQQLKSMIEARKFAGINNQSQYSNYRSNRSYYANIVSGTKGRLLVAVGSGMAEPATSRWIKILSGYHYAYYLEPSAETAWADKASGTYSAPFQTTLTAVSAGNAQIVYTLDGTTPTASSAKAASGDNITIDHNCTLTAGLLSGGKVTGIITHNYRIEAFKAYTINVYVHNNNSWANMYFYSWSNNTKNASAEWPGNRITATETIGGKRWYKATYSIESDDDVVNLVFNNGSGTQTVDVTGIKQDAYLDINTTQSAGKYTVTDVTAATGINDITTSAANNGEWYNLQGQRIAKPEKHGLYIRNGKKIIVKD